MRAKAQVLPRTLTIDSDHFVFGQVGDDLGLVRLADLAEVGDGVVAVPDLADDLLVPVHDLAHALLDQGEVVQAEGLVPGEVVIEAVLHRRPDGHLGAGKQLLHRLGHDVAGVMADHFQHVGMVPGQDLDLAPGLEDPVEVEEPAVHPDQHGLLGEGFRQAFGDGPAGDARLVAAHGTVGKLEFDRHRSWSFPGALAGSGTFGGGGS